MVGIKYLLSQSELAQVQAELVKAKENIGEKENALKKQKTDYEANILAKDTQISDLTGKIQTLNEEKKEFEANIAIYASNDPAKGWRKKSDESSAELKVVKAELNSLKTELNKVGGELGENIKRLVDDAIRRVLNEPQYNAISQDVASPQTNLERAGENSP